MRTPSKVLPITTSPTVVATDNEVDSDFTGINRLDESVAESAGEFETPKEEETVTNLEKVNDDQLEKVPRKKKTENSAGSSKKNNVSTVMRGEENLEEKEVVKRPAKVDTVPGEALKKRDENGTGTYKLSTSEEGDEKLDSDEEFIIRKPAKTPSSSAKDDEVRLGNLDDDDSFFNPPVSSKKVGKNIVKNFEKRSGRHAAPPVRPLRNNSSNNNTVTVLNDSISFLAVRETAKSLHNDDKYGTQPCGLHPYCANKFYGGEEIALVNVVSPEFHPSYEKTAWSCYHHAEASLGGMEVQTQTKSKGPVSSTPKNFKTKRSGPELTNAPMKRTFKKTKTKPAAEENLESDDGKNDEK